MDNKKMVAVYSLDMSAVFNQTSPTITDVKKANYHGLRYQQKSLRWHRRGVFFCQNNECWDISRTSPWPKDLQCLHFRVDLSIISILIECHSNRWWKLRCHHVFASGLLESQLQSTMTCHVTSYLYQYHTQQILICFLIPSCIVMMMIALFV